MIRRAWLAAGVVALVAAVVVGVVWRAPAQDAGRHAARLDALEVRELRLVDEQGMTRARLGMSQGRPALALWHPNGRLAVVLDFQPDGRPVLQGWGPDGAPAGGVAE